ncbi:RNA polymerase sigma factor [Sinomonas sp. R1AF57]|uniref:RNA polymerase sigma factor n=1 Tax=Sinomonas sp. R1AF57 TaxID=2020377 RepID=UPI000B5F177D|nr:sigma-70 family RNA polymerase sigma factor [Sinomonas sp. R1AF57]ASN53392.1 RNA polymerase subunit sigma-70 [Sinomonas sp. R1AF57]
MRHPAQASDREHTFRSLYEVVYPDLVRFVQRRAHPDHAEDVVADAFLVVWRRLDELPRRHEDARAWTFGIARNLLLNAHRGEQRRVALGVRLADAAALVPLGDDADAIVSRVDLARAWRMLSEVHQEALGLAVFEDLDAPRAAAVLGISPVAFRLRLSRARRALRTLLEHLPRPSRTHAAPLGRTTAP